MEKIFNVTTAPVVVGVFLSLIAWSVNGLVTELGKRKIVQYRTFVESREEKKIFVVRIENLSGSQVVTGARFRITPQQGKSLLPGPDMMFGIISLPGVVDVGATEASSSSEEVSFSLPVLPPGADVELGAIFPLKDPPPMFAAFYADGGDYGMRLVPASSAEAWLIRNQVVVYLCLLALGVIFIIIWAVMLLAGSIRQGENSDQAVDYPRVPTPAK